MNRLSNCVCALGLAWCGVSSAHAEPWVNERFRQEAVGSAIAIRIFDNASEGCWTNIGETRTYAEDLLREAGFEIKEEDQTSYRFEVIITAYRRDDIGCLGYIDLKVTRMAWLSDLRTGTTAVVASHGGLPSGYDRLNLLVLENTKELISAMSEE